MNGAPGLFAYIDETGDRGSSPGSSEWFALTAVIVPAEQDRLMRAIMHGIKKVVVGTDENKALHWTEHFKAKRSGRRDDAAVLLRAIPAIIVTVAVHKPCMDRTSKLATDGVTLYNYAYRLLLERLSYAAAGWAGGPRTVKVLADSVKGMNHSQTIVYLERIKANPGLYSRWPVPWGQMIWPPQWRDSGSFLGLQAADIYSGMLGTALMQSDATWLSYWAHQYRGAGSAEVWKRGLKVITACQDLCVRPHPWARLLEGGHEPPGRTRGAATD